MMNRRDFIHASSSASLLLAPTGAFPAPARLHDPVAPWYTCRCSRAPGRNSHTTEWSKRNSVGIDWVHAGRRPSRAVVHEQAGRRHRHGLHGQHACDAQCPWRLPAAGQLPQVRSAGRSRPTCSRPGVGDEVRRQAVRRAAAPRHHGLSVTARRSPGAWGSDPEDLRGRGRCGEEAHLHALTVREVFGFLIEGDNYPQRDRYGARLRRRLHP